DRLGAEDADQPRALPPRRRFRESPDLAGRHPAGLWRVAVGRRRADHRDGPPPAVGRARLRPGIPRPVARGGLREELGLAHHGLPPALDGSRGGPQPVLRRVPERVSLDRAADVRDVAREAGPAVWLDEYPGRPRRRGDGPARRAALLAVRRVLPRAP